jgi:hypothetical protein
MSATFQITPEMRRARARQNAAAYKLYWPGDQWFEDECDGHIWRIPPDLGGKEVNHPVARDEMNRPTKIIADGVCDVRNRYGVIYGKRCVPTSGGWALPILERDGQIPGQTAEEIVTFFTKKHERLGLVELTGDPNMDESIRSEARGKWLKANREWAQQELNARSEEVVTFQKKNPGASLAGMPGMKDSQRRAEKVLMMLARNDEGGKGKYVCDKDGYDTNEADDFEMHQQIRHGKAIEVPEVKSVEPEPDIEDVEPQNLIEPIVKRGPGRPRKVEEPS